MFCSGCGRQLDTGQGFCPQCGRVAAPLTPPVVPAPGFEFELNRYAGKIRILGILWLVFGGLSLLAGLAALHFAHDLFSGGFAPWNSTNTCSQTGSFPPRFTSFWRR